MPRNRLHAAHRRQATSRPNRRSHFTDRLSIERLEDRVVLSMTYTVLNTNDSGSDSLRAAIDAANLNPGTDTIDFNVGGGGVQTIAPVTALPPITDPVVIDGATQPGFAGTPIIELNGSSAGSGSIGLTITAGDSTVRGLVINRFSANGILLSGNGKNLIEGNYVGTDVTGTTDRGNSFSGIRVTSASNTIGGTAPSERNVISGNDSSGVTIDGSAATDNVVLGNYIGTNAAGTAALGNTRYGVDISGASSNIVGGMAVGSGNVISGNGDYGVIISAASTSATGNVVLGNYIGTDPSGTAAVGNAGGVQIDRAADNTIGGSTAAARNVISGNQSTHGILMFGIGATGNQLLGNYIGTDVTGTLNLGNAQSGIALGAGAADNTIGGTVAGARNVISGNGAHGVQFAAASVTGNQLQGNYIGTNAAGTGPLGNSDTGVVITNGASSNTVGGTAAGSGNVISANGQLGINITASGTTGNQVLGNLIGTDHTGTVVLGNGDDGLDISGASGNTVGGIAPGARNVIAGNTRHGVAIIFGSSNQVLGNFIGTDVTATASLGNGGVGVYVQGTSNTIGGTAAGAGNVISANSHGIDLPFGGTTGNLVQGNYIGTDLTGTLDLGNLNNGVLIELGASGNTIGGATAGARNVISGNSTNGVKIEGVASAANQVLGNYIGTDAAGTAALGNGNHGIAIVDAPDNTIGGTTAGSGNVIPHNNGHGVAVAGSTATGNAIRGNSIHDNGFLGIDLSNNGVTPNDTGDGDSGPNDLQNFPVLAMAVVDSSTYVLGTVNSAANTALTLDFYANAAADPSGFGEGQRYLGSTTVTTDGSGNASFDVTVGAATVGEFVTATATNPAGSTSEFSAAHLVTLAAAVLPDPCDSGETALFVSGTTGNDTIVVSPLGNAGMLEVKRNGTSLGTFQPTGRVVVYGRAGDDDIQVAGNIGLSAWLFGQSGDDRIKGGAGHDVLLGADGDDLLVGGQGRDFLIGGNGADRLVGNTDDDILVSGTTDHDANDAALCAVTDEWTSSGSYAQRTAHISGASGGLNGTYYLQADVTVHDDNAKDMLTGSQGQDWFFANLFLDNGVDATQKDKITDLSASEFATDLDFIES